MKQWLFIAICFCGTVVASFTFEQICQAQEVGGIIDRVKVMMEKRRPSDPDNIVERTGTIISYNREGIVMERSTGRDTTIKPEQIVSVVYSKTADHHDAVRLHREGQLLAALQWYQSALEKEKRSWVRQEIQAGATECLVNSGRRAEAARMFGTMVKEDPTSRFFHLIPLVWSEQPVNRDAINAVQPWLSSDEPVAQLMAASWILATPARQQATDILTKLSQDSDSQIAHMASAQLWRTQFLTADGQDIDRWQLQIKRMPEALRAGPEFVLGRALAQNKKNKDAAALLMKVAIVYQCEDRLKAAALYRAGQAMQAKDSNDQARLIFEELIREYPNSQPAQFARQALQSK